MAATPPASVTLAATADCSLQVVALACEHSCCCNGRLHLCCMLLVHGRGHPKASLTAPVAEFTLEASSFWNSWSGKFQPVQFSASAAVAPK